MLIVRSDRRAHTKDVDEALAARFTRGSAGRLALVRDGPRGGPSVMQRSGLASSSRRAASFGDDCCIDVRRA